MSIVFYPDLEKHGNSLAPIQNEPVIGKVLADFMDEVCEEYHSGLEKNIQDERGIDM